MALPASATAKGQDSVFDLGKLATLKRDVKADPAGTPQQQQVAKQFEALFLQMMLKRMREATPKDGIFDSQQTEMLQSMVDEQMALQLADPGIGLAKGLVAQMQQGVGGDLSNEKLDQAAQGQSVAAGFASTSSREVNALLGVLRNNRASDRALAAAEGAPEHVVNFVSKMSRAANLASQQSGVPARLILGQAALESGWGRREILNDDGSTTHNLFGIKAGSGWKGETADILTTEYEDGVPRKMVQSFRSYASYEESFADYARLLGNSPRYEGVTQARNEIEAARRIQEAGYATDPQYAQKLIGIMSQFRGVR